MPSSRGRISLRLSCDIRRVSVESNAAFSFFRQPVPNNNKPGHFWLNLSSTVCSMVYDGTVALFRAQVRLPPNVPCAYFKRSPCCGEFNVHAPKDILRMKYLVHFGNATQPRFSKTYLHLLLLSMCSYSQSAARGAKGVRSQGAFQTSNAHLSLASSWVESTV